MGLAANEQAWVRDVVLWADDRPVVFAHSVLPRAHVRGAWQLFSGMGTRPLGAALFADPRVRRLPLHFRLLDARHALYHGARLAVKFNAQTRELWARRSLFLRGGKSLLVTEVFMPDILE